MAIDVRFFASLREQLGKDSVQLNALEAGTVEEVWRKATEEASLPANTLAALNQVNAKFDAAVIDGDEVAFFPPVTGG